MSVEQATHRLLALADVTEPELVPLSKARGRVLSEPVYAPIDLPPFDNSAMDGFAVRAIETRAASPGHPLEFRIAGNVDAGSVWSEPIRPWTVVRIGTGAPIPASCDAVIPSEHAQEQAGAITVTEPVAAGSHVRRLGEDIGRGARAIPSGITIDARHIALLAAFGLDQVRTARQPRVSIMSIGPELGFDAGPARIGDVDLPMLAGMVEADGAQIQQLHRSDGSPNTLRREVESLCGDADVVLTSGAISNSPADTLTPVLASILESQLWTVRLRPGKHYGVAKLGPSIVLALPGNPVAALVGFVLFARPLIGQMLRRAPRPATHAIVRERVTGSSDRVDAIRASLQNESGTLVATPTHRHGSSIVSTLPDIDGLLLLPEGTDRVERGNPVEFEHLQYQ